MTRSLEDSVTGPVVPDLTRPDTGTMVIATQYASGRDEQLRRADADASEYHRGEECQGCVSPLLLAGPESPYVGRRRRPPVDDGGRGRAQCRW
ncbi:hypothetical protein JGS22_010090 [Streptomyces sp. P38-E01]|uniref:Uncharacterized protein n=1 Tax=Streptomyces tardus TaxID=2780544 RepID=A0A949JDK5_9ACTN|nr:hypothetical protein [Streptomyces tardus]